MRVTTEFFEVVGYTASRNDLLWRRRPLSVCVCASPMAQVEDDDFDANPGLVNAFRLAQLQTQYVLHCQQVPTDKLLSMARRYDVQ